MAPAGGVEAVSGQARLEAVEEEETVRMHLAALRREEAALQASREVSQSHGVACFFAFRLLCIVLSYPLRGSATAIQPPLSTKYGGGGFCFLNLLIQGFCFNPCRYLDTATKNSKKKKRKMACLRVI